MPLMQPVVALASCERSLRGLLTVASGRDWYSATASALNCGG
ncbi:hypothetical protein [Streptomyces sp. NPDC002550]